MSSSDEAPEEVTFNESKIAQKLEEKKRKQADLTARHASKQKRRDRDSQLKQQSHKKKLLSEILKDAHSDNEEEDNDDKIDTSETAKQSLSHAVPVMREKKTFTVKGDYTIKVGEPSRVTKNRKKLPPPGSAAVSKREEFLFRESVPRK